MKTTMNTEVKWSRLIKIFKNSVLVTISIIFTIYLLETAYALYNVSSYKINKWSKNNLNKFDVYNEEIKNNIKTSVTISSLNHIKR